MSVQNPLRISGKDLGQLALPGFCARCFWLSRKISKLPCQVFPGIFSSIDSCSKQVVHGWFARHNSAPPLIGLGLLDAVPGEALLARAGRRHRRQGESGVVREPGQDRAGPLRPEGQPRQQSGSAVPLGLLAAVHVVTGPPMIKDENGVLVGYVFADIDSAQRDLGGWVTDAKRLVRERLALSAGFRLQWTGQYEFMADMEARMRIVLPLTLVLIVGLLYLSLRGWAQTWLVLMSLPFAIAGSIWLLALLHYNLSTAVWVGLIAVGGVAAQTGIVVVAYLDQALGAALAQGRLRTGSDVDRAVVEGAAKCLRPMLMTVATTVLGLMPLLFESGVGADLSARTVAPVVGGLWSCMFLTLLVLPAAYTIWRRWQLARGRLPSPAASAAT